MGAASTREITNAIARGDPEAFAVFYRASFDDAVRLVHALTKRDESFCLDVVQDAMVRVIRSLRPMETAADLRRWFARVVHTTALDHLKQELRRTARHERAWGAAGRAARAAPDPADLAERAERVRELSQRLEELERDDRHLLHLRFTLGMTLEQAAAADDPGERGVRAGRASTGAAAHGRVRRVLARLRSAFSESRP